MKVYMLAVAAVMAGGVTWAMLPSEVNGIDPLVSGSIPEKTKAFTVSSIGGDLSCRAERGSPVSNRSRQFTAPTDCDAVWPGLSSAKTWTENEDGTVILSDTRGEAVLTIVEGDGPGYEALEPAEAAIMLRAAD